MTLSTRSTIKRALLTATVVTAAFALAGCSALFPSNDSSDSGNASTEESSSSEETPSAEEQSTDVFALAVGDCLNAITGMVSEVPTVDCAAPHEFEVYYEFELEDPGKMPTDDEMIAEADRECLAAFETFVGLPYDASALNFTYYYPTADSWKNASDRLVSCMITDPTSADGTTVGTLAGAAR